jgi:hypothetical protein
MLPLLVIGALTAAAGGGGVAVHRRFFRKKTMNAEQQQLYQNALATLADSTKLRQLAEIFRKEGFRDEAKMLEQRASLRDLPEDVKKGRREAFRKTMQQTDPAVVNQMADLYEKEGAWGSAQALRKYAATLKPVSAADKPQI